MQYVHKYDNEIATVMEFTNETKDQSYNFVTCNTVADFDYKGEPILIVQTPKGNQRAVFGDFVVRTATNEFYVYNPEIFHTSYCKLEDYK